MLHMTSTKSMIGTLINEQARLYVLRFLFFSLSLDISIFLSLGMIVYSVV